MKHSKNIIEPTNIYLVLFTLYASSVLDSREEEGMREEKERGEKEVGREYISILDRLMPTPQDVCVLSSKPLNTSPYMVKGTLRM